MTILLGADHRGYKLKEHIKDFLTNQGYQYQDFSAGGFTPEDDFVDFAVPVAREIARAPEETRGFLFCGSGAGMAIAANKFNAVRAAVAVNPDQVFALRHEDNVNVLCFAADTTAEDQAEKMATVFVNTPAGDEARYRRRVEKILKLENDRDTAGH